MLHIRWYWRILHEYITRYENGVLVGLVDIIMTVLLKNLFTVHILI